MFLLLGVCNSNHRWPMSGAWRHPFDLTVVNDANWNYNFGLRRQSKMFTKVGALADIHAPISGPVLS